jgi:photosystem II stability/assembly factor-like uncharacterized protein
MSRPRIALARRIRWVALAFVVSACTQSSISSTGSAPPRLETTTTVSLQPAPPPSGPPVSGAAVVPTGSAVWTLANIGGGGAMNSPVIAPSGTWAVGTDLSGLALSDNQGASWRVIGEVQGLTATHVASLAVRPDSGQWIIGTDRGVFVASSDGSTVAASTGLDQFSYIGGVAVASDPNVVYVAAHPGFDQLSPRIYRSSDGGATFASRGALDPTLRIVNLVASPSNPDELLAVTGTSRFVDSSPSQVWRSVDGGSTWAQMDPANGTVLSVAYDVAQPTRIYVTTATTFEQGGLYASDDGGANWETLTTDHAGFIWLDHANAAHLRLLDLGTQFPWEERRGVFDSTDGGRTWRQLGPLTNWDSGWSKAEWVFESGLQGDHQSLGASPNNPDVLLWTTSQFTFASTDGGVTFHKVTSAGTPGALTSTGLDNVIPFTVATSPSDPNLVIAGLFDVGCVRSTNRGATWWPCNQPLLTGKWVGQGGNVPAIAFDPVEPSRVWAAMGGDLGDGNEIVRSDGGGEAGTWTPNSVGLPPGSLTTSLAVIETAVPDERDVYATVNGDIYRLAGGQERWVLIDACGTCRSMWRIGPVVVAGGEQGLRVLRDLSQPSQWESVGPSQWSGTVPGNWWDYSWTGVSGFAVDSDGRWWVAATGSGLWRSDDAGSGWAQVTTDPLIRDVAVVPAVDGQPGVLWTASSTATKAGGFSSDSRGFQQSTDGGQTFTAVNDQLAWPMALRLHVAADGLWGAVPGQGVVWRR